MNKIKDIVYGLHNDEGGHVATKKLLDSLERVEDRSFFYTEMGLNDINDFLQAQQKEECERYRLKR